jgi:hypothetical protein
MSPDRVFDTKLLAADVLERKKNAPNQRTAAEAALSKAKASRRALDQRGREAERQVLAAMRKSHRSKAP